MSYAIETKKRKFDRILESLTDGTSSQSRPALNSRNNAPNLADGEATSIDASKRRRITPTSHKSANHSSLTGHYLPSSRVAFLERLETFRHVTKWHVPSTTPINAAAWAKRGWTCVDTDVVSCGSCKERVTVNLDLDDNKHILQDTENKENGETDDAFEGADMAAEVYAALLKRYQDMIVTSHMESCPWKKRGCDASIQRIEGLLNSGTAVATLRTRYESISENPDEIPEVTELPAHEAVEVNNDEIKALVFDSAPIKRPDAIRLAVCGWQRKDIDVIECRHCFRSLGLWLYRGDQPSMENLDPIDSHLDYCPWRSADAQDTEIALRNKKSDHTSSKVRVPGWVLVYLAVAKLNAKKRGDFSRSSTPIAIIDGSEVSLESVSPEQREKKMKDLMRRIKEIKKPFNVKGLLRKKESSSKPNS